MNLTKQKTYILSGLAIIIVVAAGYWIFSKQNSDRSETGDIYLETVSRPDLALTFQYESGDSGLALFEPEVDGEPLKAAFILMPAKDYVHVRNGEAGETPPTVSVFVFTKPEQAEDSDLTRLQEVEQWAKNNQQLTSINLAKAAPEEVEIDGVKALHYFADGLYQQEIYIASYQRNIYMFVGQFDNSEDKITQDFRRVLSSVLFE